MPEIKRLDKPVTMYREMPIHCRATANDENDNYIEFTASSETPVYRFGDKEILVHTSEAVRLDRLRSIGALLVNHDPGQRAGAIESAAVENGVLRIGARFLSTDFGQTTKTEVREGGLRGVSVSYRVYAWEIDEEAREIRAVDWEVYEASLTPIPADASVGIGRSDSMDEGKWKQIIQIKSAAMPAEETKERGQQMPGEKEPQAKTADNGTDDSAIKAREEAQKVADRAQMQLAIVRAANQHGVRIDDEKLDEFESVEDGMRHVMAQMGKRYCQPEDPVITDRDDQGGKGVRIKVGPEHVEKREAAIDDSLCARFGAPGEKDMGLRGRSILQLGEEYLRAHNIDVPGNRVQLARMLFERSANVSSSNFTSYVLVNAMDKAIMNGYNIGRKTYDQWCVIRRVKDFKTYYGAALDVGSLTQVAENEAFPEIGKSEDGYSDTLKMWGCTISLTLQAYINDDLGQFDRLLGRAGAIAQNAIEKQVYTEVEDATWTGHTTTTGELGTKGNLAKGVSAFMNRTSAGQSEVLNIMPEYLIVPSGLYEDGLQKTTQVQGSTERVVNTFLTPIIAPHLTTASTPANSTYYLAASPAIADTCVVAFLEGLNGPMTMEYDSLAVAKRNWKIMLPFETTLPSNLIGMHQCTQS
jgi:HK97 family phage prohead protease